MKPVAVLLLAAALSLRGATLPGREITDPELDAYFRAETRKIADHCLTEPESAADWRAHLSTRRQQMREMLGLEPLPARGDLQVAVTGRTDHDKFTVENLQFQSSPGLYVTANLYVPKGLARPAPTILYVCGHSPVITNGISYGSKFAYQHHGIWFAQNGYVCLVMDTLELGEIRGLHHGTYREGMWWWNSRGYTPAGVETWNGIRALDYLSTRPEVDTNRFGITGRSGGGAYSWFITAVDERIRAAAPVAGITDLENYVSDGCVEGHCDCMFFVNTYRWDYPMLAALAAPRPLLLCNTDADTIFPLDGVVRLHSKVRRVYKLLGAEADLGLVITPGPHKDTQELQLPVMRWLDKYLKGEQPPVETAAAKLFHPEQLRVFTELPRHSINTNIHDTFVARSAPVRLAAPVSRTALTELETKCFAGWPHDAAPVGPNSLRQIPEPPSARGNEEWFELESQPHVRLLMSISRSADSAPRRVVLRIPGRTPSESAAPNTGDAVVTLFVRGIGPNAWAGDVKKQTQIRRRFMLLGQTLDAMRVWDIRRGIQAVRALPLARNLPLRIEAEGAMAVNASYALLFEEGAAETGFTNWPASEGDQPDYLNAARLGFVTARPGL